MRLVSTRAWALRAGLLVALIAMMMIAAGPAGHPAAAQATEAANPVVDYGRPAQGQISDSAPEQSWRLLASAKDRLAITVDRTDGTLVPGVQLLDQNNNPVASATKDATFARAMIREIILPRPGQYTVVVGRYQGKEGKTSGKYKLVVALLGTGEDGLGTTVVEAEVKLGEVRSGTLTNARWEDTWAVTLPSADPVTIRVTRAGGTLVPNVRLLDTKQKELASAQADDTFSASTITGFVPPAAGQYLVVVSRLDRTNGSTTGDYQLQIMQGKTG